MPFEAAMIAGLGMQVAGQYQAGKEAEALGESQAAISEYNVQLAEREAIEAREAAAYEESKFLKGAERLKATQRARYAKGITLEGSPSDVLEATAIELKKDALNIRRGGQIGARRLTAEAQLHRYAGKSALLRGRAARRSSYLKMAATGLMGGAELGYMKYKMGGGGGGLTDEGRATLLKY